MLKNGEGCTSLSGHGRDFLEVEADRGWADQERLATASICSFLNDLPMVCVCVCVTELPDVHQSEVTYGYLCARPWHDRVSTRQSLAFVTGNQ